MSRSIARNTDLTTVTGDVNLYTPTAFAVNSTTVYWAVEIRIFYNAVVGNFSGYALGMQGATLISPVALSNIPVTVTSQAKIAFCCGGFYSATNAGNVATMICCELDQV